MTTIDTSDLSDEQREEFAAFRRQVRDSIVKASVDNSWCVPGTNEALEALGLDELQFENSARFAIYVDIPLVEGEDRHEVYERYQYRTTPEERQKLALAALNDGTATVDSVSFINVDGRRI